MSEEPYKVTVNLPQEPDFTEDELSGLRQQFKASIVEVLERRGEHDRPVVDDITRIAPPHKEP